MRLSKFFLFVALIFSIASCQSSIEPKTKQNAKHIFAKYYVRYLQTEKELKAEVSFKEGDTLATARSIVLNDVSFEKNKMKIQNLGKSHGIRYSVRKQSPYSQKYNFEYTSEHLGPLSHQLEMEPITDFSVKDGIVKKAEGMILQWEGAPLTKQQKLVLLFTDEQKKAVPIQISGPTTESQITIDAEKLDLLSVGKGRLMVVKKQLSQTKEQFFTKISEMEFYSNNQDIEIAL